MVGATFGISSSLNRKIRQMKLRQLWEDIGLQPDLGTQHKAMQLAGNSAEEASHIEDQLTKQQEIQDKDPKTGQSIKRARKQTLQKLGNANWDPKNTKFQKLAAQALTTDRLA